MSECNHPCVQWCYSQWNPDFGICTACGVLAIAEGPTARIYYNDGDKVFWTKAKEILEGHAKDSHVGYKKKLSEYIENNK